MCKGEVLKGVLVIGASGFVGQSLCVELRNRGETVYAAARRPEGLIPDVTFVPLPDLRASVDWAEVLQGLNVDRIVYLAARVHVMQDRDSDPLASYRAVNRDAVLALAEVAAERGIQRLVYLSSVKVNGESSSAPLTEDDPPKPNDPYGVSKFEAEQALLAMRNQLEVVVIRPPLVYGPGVRANFMALARAAGRGIPLPLGAVRNRRSLVYVENLVDFINVALTHPAAAGEVFFVADDKDLSTVELTRLLAEGQGKRIHLPAVPLRWLWVFARLTRRQDVIGRLLGSLQVSTQKARTVLDWSPPYPSWLGLKRTGAQLRVTGQATYPSVTRERIVLTPAQRLYLLIRHPIDTLVAAFMLLAALPLILSIALLISLDSKGPVLFIQERAGRDHNPFRIFKFRTMFTDTPHLSTEQMAQSGLSTVTRVGRFLRRSSLDELPQLLNIIRGEMSFVGPRPALMSQTPVLKGREQLGVHTLRPGITGYAQVTGRDDLPDHEKVRRDGIYMKLVGLKMDLRVLWMTLGSVLKGIGTK